MPQNSQYNPCIGLSPPPHWRILLTPLGHQIRPKYFLLNYSCKQTKKGNRSPWLTKDTTFLDDLWWKNGGHTFSFFLEALVDKQTCFFPLVDTAYFYCSGGNPKVRYCIFISNSFIVNKRYRCLVVGFSFLLIFRTQLVITILSQLRIWIHFSSLGWLLKRVQGTSASC